MLYYVTRRVGSWVAGVQRSSKGPLPIVFVRENDAEILCNRFRRGMVRGIVAHGSDATVKLCPPDESRTVADCVVSSASRETWERMCAAGALGYAVASEATLTPMTIDMHLVVTSARDDGAYRAKLEAMF